MIAALCFLIPPFITILIRCGFTPEKEKFYRKVIQFIVSFAVVNALALLLSFALFAGGRRPVYNLNHTLSFALMYLILAVVIGIVSLIIEKIIRSHSIKNAIKALTFVLIAAACVVLVGFVAQPVWEDDNYNATHGFYEVENNTIETLFLGSSHVRCGISPMLLYEEYGISSFDLSTDDQPVLASYYWLEEAYRLHSETLDTVVLDTSMLIQTPTNAYFHKAIDPMRLSPVKVRAVRAYSDGLSDFLTNLSPLLTYHDRWEEVTGEDFSKFKKDSQTFLRGNVFSASQWVSSASDESVIPSPLLVADEEAAPVATDDLAVEYLGQIVSFCEEHDISLVLINLPTEWTSGEHNAIQALADEYGLDFIDFNVDPYYSETGFDMATDFMVPGEDDLAIGNLHANYYGSRKLTDYMGQYLIGECGNRDVRGDEAYAFMDDELEDYSRYTVRIKLREFEDPAEYLSYLTGEEDYEIFITVKDDASAALTEEQRACFSSLGLTELADLGYGDSYLAVIDDGEVLTEERGDSALTAEGTMDNGMSYLLNSCGGTADDRAVSSCVIDGTENSGNNRGLNIVVYDKKLDRVADATEFDTSVSATRKPVYVEAALEQDLANGVPYDDLSGSEQRLYQYLAR